MLLNKTCKLSGLYWHKNKGEKDYARDVFVKSEGYKVLRIKANKQDKLPTKDELVESINELLFTDKKFKKLDMNK